MNYDAQIYWHKEWLGLLQPIGLVVSPPALVKAQAFIDNSSTIELQQHLKSLVSQEKLDFPTLAIKILNWLPEDLVKDLPTDLEVVLPDYGETLRPTYAVKDPDIERWIILIQEVTPEQSLDEVELENTRGWKATINAKFERLLRETQIPIGLLFNGIELRLIYAPRGESSGYLTFPIQAMTEVSGRLILGALEMLLGADRLFNVSLEHRLPKILSDSRDYQAEVSTKLASQVLDALWELLTGFQTADALVNGALLQRLAQDNPEQIYGGLITVLMRLVFMLYAEDEGLMPDDPIYQQNYAVSGLYERLREDVGNYPDTMEQRYGAWAGLLSLFRLVYQGGGHTPNYLPARHGQLFDPQEYPFLEGGRRQEIGGRRQEESSLDVPRISDDTVYRILDNLLMLDGERLSYRALDVEQIGSVYEAIMGFEIQVAQSPSIALRPFDVVINIEHLLAQKPTERAKLLQDEAQCKLSSKESAAVKEAKTVDELLAALNNKISSRTPNLLPIGSLFLQPGSERRRTGSHYTPRKLTGPIVETTLSPVLERLGPSPTAEEILSLKVCDLAMGSGAFLVEVCRFLSEKVVEAWEREGGRSQESEVRSQEGEPLLVARRLIAQRCLYGVDKNPFAVNLAKLSLWLVTLAKDRPFTFVDHALKCGDSLVGLTKAQIGAFTWIPQKQGAELGGIFATELQEGLNVAEAKRNEIYNLADVDYEKKRELNLDADTALKEAKLRGNLIVSAFFSADKNKAREEKLNELRLFWNQHSDAISDAVSGSPLINGGPGGSFNWEIEFPEVFDMGVRGGSGFNAIVGNPPFMGKNTLINAHAEGYQDWLKEVYPESNGNADLVAFFFRRAFELLNKDGTMGLIATNTISQGDTRSTGLRYICNNGGVIYHATKRYKWPGMAAVVVSVINIYKGQSPSLKTLNNKEVTRISAFLFHAGGNDDPKPLIANEGKSFQGSIVLGMGFTFDDSNPEATSIAEMERLIEKDPRNKECIFPFISGEDVNSDPTHTHNRYVINFGTMTEDEARQYPDLMSIVEEKVKPEREKLGNNPDALRRKNKWWLWGRYTPALFKTIAPLERVLVCPLYGKYLHFVFLPSKMVFANKLNVMPFDSFESFAILQSRIHEIFAWFFSSTLKDDLAYAPSDCFETFPFPPSPPNSSPQGRGGTDLETIGKTYYEFRAELMIRNNQGLTETYNRFHDPYEIDSDILKLRELHTEMDRVVLEAYGWSDLDSCCGFALDYLDIDVENLPSEVQERIASGDLYFPTVEEAANFNSLVATGKKKLPWRYRWSEAIHDEVLARLLDLNQKRAEEEILLGTKEEQKTNTKQSTKPKGKKKPKGDDNSQLKLIN